MKEKKEKEKIVLEVTSITCDRCGDIEKIQCFEGPDVASFKYTFGYLSSKDGSTIEFDLCEKCLDEILDKEGVDYRLEGPSGFGG